MYAKCAIILHGNFNHKIALLSQTDRYEIHLTPILWKPEIFLYLFYMDIIRSYGRGDIKHILRVTVKPAHLAFFQYNVVLIVCSVLKIQLPFVTDDRRLKFK